MGFLEACRTEGMEFILTRHEGTAKLMAEALARLSGRPGRLLSAPGPGLTNLVNATPNGLATGVFTPDITAALSTARALYVGGAHINETCSSRLDLMPYGGVKASGSRREGPRHATREMAEDRLITLSGPQ